MEQWRQPGVPDKRTRFAVGQDPQDLDAKMLYGAAVSWGKPLPKVAAQDANVGAARVAVQEAIRNDPAHAGAHHYLAHLVEAYPHRDMALQSADALKTLVPGAEHLVHMPSHVYFLLGRYREATESDIQAVAAFRQYERDSRAQGFEPEINFLDLHDEDFLRASAAMEDRSGDGKLALANLRRAMQLQDGMRYHEPPDWYFPVTQALGDAYLKWNSPDRAAQMYRKALDKHPENGWSLFGLALLAKIPAHSRPAGVGGIPQPDAAAADSEVAISSLKLLPCQGCDRHT
jgi:tetratricopeptide (TPR) repeat protein